MGNQVDAFGRAANEDDFARFAGTEELVNDVSRAFEGIRRSGRERVGRAVNVGIVVRVIIGDRIDHGLRFLGRRGVIEPDEWFAVDLLMQRRKILPDGMNVQWA